MYVKSLRGTFPRQCAKTTRLYLHILQVRGITVSDLNTLKFECGFTVQEVYRNSLLTFSSHHSKMIDKSIACSVRMSSNLYIILLDACTTPTHQHTVSNEIQRFSAGCIHTELFYVRCCNSPKPKSIYRRVRNCYANMFSAARLNGYCQNL